MHYYKNMTGRKFTVSIKKKAQKSLSKMPKEQRETFFLLVEDLETSGPFQPEWSKYSKLGKDEYHCHLSLHWVACWKWLDGTAKIEVYYVGSRENAPY